MSTKSKLLAMTEDLRANQGTDSPAQALGGGGAGPIFPPVLPRSVAKTGPGQMVQFRGHLLAHETEVRELKEQLQQHEGSVPTRLLDTNSVIPSRWANRHSASFEAPEFVRLRQDIETAGGNVQPILVRPAKGSPGKFEIVFGHRRHRACSELGIPVLATIDSSVETDAGLFAAMDRENRERADLSPYEQGSMYRHALTEGLYPSNRRLAEALGVSHTWVSNVLAVADLPPPLVECFRSPLEIQPKHARALAGAYESDRKAVLRRAEKLKQTEARLGATAVVDALTKQKAAPVQAQDIQVNGQRVGSWRRDGAGRLVIELRLASVADDQVASVIAQLEAALQPSM